jgi:hypothetical protein
MAPFTSSYSVALRPVNLKALYQYGWPEVLSSLRCVLSSARTLRPVTTTSMRQQQGYVSSERWTCTSLADRCKSLQCRIHACHSAPATQRRSARPATHSLPAEPGLLTSERPGKICRTQTAPFRATVPANQRRPRRGLAYSITHAVPASCFVVVVQW